MERFGFNLIFLFFQICRQWDVGIINKKEHNKQMCLIAGQVVIDEFTLRLMSAVYILTHWHSDHYQGITQGWPYGQIYASKVTRQLLLTKYPKLQQTVHVLPLREWTRISYKVAIYAFESNHMAGSIMMLLRVHDNYYMHTGDMRFNRKIAESTPDVFVKGEGDDFLCRYKIEQLHLDNTFCDPIFKFPARSKAIRMLVNLVSELQPSRLFLCTDSVGKEQVFVMLSKYYKKRVVVSRNRWTYIAAMDFDHELYFTTDLSESWIEVIPKSEKEERIGKTKGAIAVTLTGWANFDHPYPDGYNSYLLPYSLHSNFREMEMLVSWVRPKKLMGVVKENNGRWDKFGKGSNYSGYVYSLVGIKQRGMAFLREQYCFEKEATEQQKKNCQKQQNEGHEQLDD